MNDQTNLSMINLIEVLLFSQNDSVPTTGHVILYHMNVEKSEWGT